MRSWTIAFALGVCVAQMLSELPPKIWLMCILGLVPPALCLRRLRLPFAVMLGFAWAVFRAACLLQVELPPQLEGQVLNVVGTIIDLPETVGDSTRFQFRTQSLQLGERHWPACGNIRLDWQVPASLQLLPGQRWQLQVRLKRPHGFSNPGSFDYELWLLQNRIRATGYVVGGNAEKLSDGGASIDRWRTVLARQLHESIGFHPLHGIVEALAIGARGEISVGQRQVFANTNTGHLIAISGLHIGLLAAIGFFIGRWLWTLPVQTLRWIPAQRVGALSGALTAAGYCALAGFDVPAQRTLIMIIVVAVNLWRARRVRSLDTLLTALLLVLIFDPLAVTEVGFWLSFVAVLVLIYATGEIVAASGFWRQCIYVHWAIAVGIAPLLAYFFATIPLVGPPANLFAVPWVSFVVVPLTLLGTFVQPWLPFLGYWFLRGALLALELLWVPLQWLAQLPHATVATPHPNVAALACAAVGALVALMPAGLPARTLALVWFAPLFLCSPPRPQAGEFELTVLDVGQGLSAVVLMREHVLVFDTGPAFSERFDAGSAVVVPFLRHHGITHVDALVVSHGDNDHIGGAASLFKAMDVMRTLSSVPQKIQHGKVETCMQGQQWTWDGVVFHMLGPASDARLTGNDASCVLKVQNRSGERSVLLTGDIEAVGERSLLSSGAGLLSSTLVVAPHHGSATSSTDAFVAATRPQLLAFAVGYKNRWRFPNPDVVNRWRSAGAQQFRTDEDGAISWNSEAGIQLQRFRRDHRHYWRAATQVQSEVGNQR